MALKSLENSLSSKIDLFQFKNSQTLPFKNAFIDCASEKPLQRKNNSRIRDPFKDTLRLYIKQCLKSSWRAGKLNFRVVGGFEVINFPVIIEEN